MSSANSNATCFDQRASFKPPPLIQNGKLVIQAYLVGWVISGVFALIAIVISLWLVNKHLMWYTNKIEQRYIIRILFLVPIYAAVSFASFIFWNTSTPLLLLRDCYEATVLTAFFYLLLLYLSPDENVQRDIFRQVGISREAEAIATRKGQAPQKWMFPLGFVKSKPEDGLYFLQMMKWGVLQYCVVRPTTTLIAIILNAVGLYCNGSWSPGWGYLYITTTVSISVSISMYCLLQLYFPITPYLKSKSVVLKIFAIKAVVFLTFWQGTFLSLLNVFGIVKSTQYMTADDVDIGIGALIETIEMAIFALIHVRAFSYKPYVLTSPSPALSYVPYHSRALLSSEPKAEIQPQLPYPPKTRLLNLLHAFDFRDTLIELYRGTIYLIMRSRGSEVKTDKEAKRRGDFGVLFGETRLDLPSASEDVDVRNLKGNLESEKEPMKIEISVTVEEEVIGAKEPVESYGYDARRNRHKHRRSRHHRDHLHRKENAGIAQIERHRREGTEIGGWLRGVSQSHSRPPSHSEDSKQGMQVNDEEALLVEQPLSRTRYSWWRSVYERVSQTGQDGHEPLEDEDIVDIKQIDDVSNAYSPAQREETDTRNLDSNLTSFTIKPAAPKSHGSLGQNNHDTSERDYRHRYEIIVYDDPPPPSIIHEYQSRHTDYGQPTSLDFMRVSVDGPGLFHSNRNQNRCNAAPVPSYEASPPLSSLDETVVKSPISDSAPTIVKQELHPNVIQTQSPTKDKNRIRRVPVNYSSLLDALPASPPKSYSFQSSEDTNTRDTLSSPHFSSTVHPHSLPPGAKAPTIITGSANQIVKEDAFSYRRRF